jgi:hypothetical protein
MQIKTMLRFHLTSVRMAILKNTNTRNVGEDGGCGGKACLNTAGGNVN